MNTKGNLASTPTVDRANTEEQQILASPCASYWLKDAIKASANRDVVDAYYDALALARVCADRMKEAGITNEVLSTFRVIS